MSIFVDGTEIADRAIAREMQNHPAATLDAARDAAGRALVLRHLLRREAVSAGLLAAGADDDLAPQVEEQAIETLLEQRLDPPDADEETCRRYWTDNRSAFRSPDLVQARHILLAAAADSAEERAAAKSKCAALIAELQRPGADFTALAHAHSACPSGANGGQLGQLTRGQTVSELDTYLFNLDLGLCPVPVASRYGFHVLQIDHRANGRDLPYDSVRHRVAAVLQQRAWRAALAQYLGGLVDAATIRGIELRAADGPAICRQG